MTVKRIVLHFPSRLVDQPIVYRMVKDFDLQFNILKAYVTPREEGLLVLELSGEDKNFDKALIIAAFAIFAIGLATVHSATQARGLAFGESFLLRQANWMAIGVIVLAVIIAVSYQRFIDLSYILYGINKTGRARNVSL